MSLTPTHSYRPIAPSIAPQPILPRPASLDNKRKWASSQDSLQETHGNSLFFCFRNHD